MHNIHIADEWKAFVLLRDRFHYVNCLHFAYILKLGMHVLSKLLHKILEPWPQSNEMLRVVSIFKTVPPVLIEL